MNRLWTAGLIAALAGATLLGQTAARKSADRIRLESAITLDIVDGQVQKAVEAYKSLAASGDRAVAAEARLRLGQAYQRLGDPRMTAALESVLELPEQERPAAEARKLLAGGASEHSARPSSPRTVVMDTREVNVEYPAVSLDGRFLAYTDYTRANGNLMIRDFSSGVDRQLTNDAEAPGREVVEKSFSRDARRIAYVFDWNELRIIEVAGNGNAAPRVLLRDQSTRSVAPYDWSSDGSKIAVQAGFKDQSTRIGYVTVADGVFHPLRSLDWRGSTRLSLSPDGAYLAYDRPAENGDGRDVYVIATNGTREDAIVTGSGPDTVVGWSADGRQLLYASERSGTTGLWARPMNGGRPSGAAQIRHPDFKGTPVGITASGDVYVDLRPVANGFTMAEVDLKTGKARPLPAPRTEARSAEFSPDGKSIAYLATDRLTINIRTLATGRTRDLRIRDMGYVQGLEWSPDGKSFLGGGADIRNRPATVRIDAASGETATLALRPEFELRSGHQWSADGKRLMFVSVPTKNPGRLPGIRVTGQEAPKFLERDLATGEERELFKFATEPWGTFGAAVSPDGRLVASRGVARSDGGGLIPAYKENPTSYVVIHSLGGGEARRLWTAPFPGAFDGPIDWLPDGSGLVVGKYVGADVRVIELWIVPLDGSAPRKLDTGVSNLLPGSRLSPDGRHMALRTGDTREDEVRVFERVVPGPAKR